MSKFTIIAAEPGWQRVGGCYDKDDDDAFVFTPAVPVIAWAIGDGEGHRSIGIVAGETVAAALEELGVSDVAYISPAGQYVADGIAYDDETDWLTRVESRGRFREKQRVAREKRTAEKAAGAKPDTAP